MSNTMYWRTLVVEMRGEFSWAQNFIPASIDPELPVIVRDRLNAGDAFVNLAALFGVIFGFAYCIGFFILFGVGMLFSGNAEGFVLIAIVAICALIAPIIVLGVAVIGLLNQGTPLYYLIWLVGVIPAILVGLSGFLANPVTCVIIIIRS